MKKKLWGVVALMAVLCGGCGPFEKYAITVLAGSGGFLTAAQTNHLEEWKANCDAKIVPTIKDPLLCAKLRDTWIQAAAAQNLAVDALETYCGWPAKPTPEQLEQFKSIPCRADKSAKAALQAAIQNLNVLLEDYKAVAK